jgi:hypothetical protein
MEANYYNTFATLNYVQYQPAYVNTPAYTSSAFSNAALVCALGLNNYDFFLGVGAVSSHSKVSHLPTVVSNPKQAYTDTKWKSYGGSDVQPSADYTGRMKSFDDMLNLAFYFSSLQAGEVASFEFVHVGFELGWVLGCEDG